MKQQCVTEKYPDYAWLSSDTNNLKGNMFRNSLQIPRTETNCTAISHPNFFLNIVSMAALNWEHPLYPLFYAFCFKVLHLAAPLDAARRVQIPRWGTALRPLLNKKIMPYMDTTSDHMVPKPSTFHILAYANFIENCCSSSHFLKIYSLNQISLLNYISWINLL
jgi:hypothetical protein